MSYAIAIITKSTIDQVVGASPVILGPYREYTKAKRTFDHIMQGKSRKGHPHTHYINLVAMSSYNPTTT